MSPANQSSPAHKHVWIKVRGHLVEKCEGCGAVRQDPDVRRAELEEAARMQRGGSR